MPDTFPLEQLRELLDRARQQDPECKRFGAKHHQYQWNPPASPEQVEALEEQIGVTLPEQYRQFLLQAADGGAGPFYGLYSLEQVKSWLTWPVEPELPPLFHPEDRDIDLLVWYYEEGENWRRGCIPIGSQGDTYFTYLLVSGPHRGQVVYVEYEASWYFFPREPDFLSWYTRWLREAVAGYQSRWFATELDGDQQALRLHYRQADTDQERWLALASMEKFPEMDRESKELLEQAVWQWAGMEDARQLLDLSRRVCPTLFHRLLEERWKKGLYPAVVQELSYALLHFPEEKQALLRRWSPRVLQQLPRLPQESWWRAARLLSQSGDIRLDQVDFLLNQAQQQTQRMLLQVFCRFPDAQQRVDLWLPALNQREDLKLLETALRTVPRCAHPDLERAARQVQRDFAFAVEKILHIDLKDPQLMKQAALRSQQHQIYAAACALWRDVFLEVINPETPAIPRPYRLELTSHDSRDMGMHLPPPPNGIPLHPLVALAVREHFGRLPSTAYDWNKQLARMKKLVLKPDHKTVQAWDDLNRRVTLRPADEHFPPPPCYFTLSDWSCIGRMTGLRALTISELCVEDFSFLSQCKNLQTLSLVNTNFSDCRLLLGLPALQTADLRRCPLTHREALEGTPFQVMLEDS